MWTLAMLALTGIAWAFGMPASLVVLLTGPATIALATIALVHSRGVEAAGGIRIWLWIAIGVGGLSTLGGLGLVIMRGPIEQLEACMDRAITETAKRECQTQYDKAYEDLLTKYSNYGTVKNP
jgi:hypothetical protein